MRKQAPMRVALQRTSRSIGNVIPKLSMSVKASLMSPVHCLEILPTSFSPSGVMTLNSTSPAQEKVHQGPLMIRATLPSASVISNLGFMQDHNWLTYPMTSPGGELTSRDWRQQGKQQESQRRGLFR